MNPFDGLIYNEDGSKQFPDKQVVGGVNNYHQHQMKSKSKVREDPDDDDSTIAEKDAKNAEIKDAKTQAAANEKKRFWDEKFNRFDGTYHLDDGSRVFEPEGQAIGGVNNYHQKKIHSRARDDNEDDDSTIAEKDAKNAEINEAKTQAAVNEKKRMDEETREKWAKKLNVFDGLYHMEDGSRVFSPGGPVVDGANNYHQRK